MIEAEAPSFVALYAATMALMRPTPEEREWIADTYQVVGLKQGRWEIKAPRKARKFTPTISEFLLELETQQARWNDRLKALSDLREKHELATTMIEKVKEEVHEPRTV